MRLAPLVVREERELRLHVLNGSQQVLLRKRRLLRHGLADAVSAANRQEVSYVLRVSLDYRPAAVGGVGREARVHDWQTEGPKPLAETGGDAQSQADHALGSERSLKVGSQFGGVKVGGRSLEV